MPDLPAAAIQAAAAAIERELLSGTDYSMSQDSGDALATVALEAAWPILAEAVAAKILTHMEAHWPPAHPGQARNVPRYYTQIAAQVAATALFTEDELKQAIPRRCQMPADGDSVTETVTEWGYRCEGGCVHFCYGGEQHARGTTATCGGTVVRRAVTYSPWEEVPDAT